MVGEEACSTLTTTLVSASMAGQVSSPVGEPLVTAYERARQRECVRCAPWSLGHECRKDGDLHEEVLEDVLVLHTACRTFSAVVGVVGERRLALEIFVFV